MDKDELQKALEAALKNEAYEQLEDLAKQAISTHPQDAFGYADLGEALLGKENIPFPEVELCLAKASELEPNNTHYLARFAHVKSMQGAADVAQLMWGKILSIDPKHQQALLEKGAYQLTVVQDYEQALGLFNRALEQEEIAAAYLYRADAYNNLGQYTEALKDIKQATTLQEGFKEEVNLLTIDVLKNLQQLEATLPLFEELLEKGTPNYIYHLEYAQLLLALKQEQKAVQQLEIANEMTENKDTTILYTLGETALKIQQYDKAVEAFKACLVIEPELTEAAFLVIKTLTQQEEYQQALETLQELQSDLTEDALLVDKANVLKGEILIGLKKYNDAEELLVPIAKQRGMYQTEAYFQLGRLYHQQGENAKAYKFVKAATAGTHAAAEQYLRTQLNDTLYQLRDAALSANQSAFVKNEKSVFLNQLFNKLWVFADLKSERLSEFSPQQIENVKQSLASSSLLMGEKGVLVLSDRQEEMATYKIQKETNSSTLVEFLPMDGFAPFVVKLQLTADGLLAFSKEKGEVLLYKEQAPDTIDNSIRAIYQNKVQSKDAQYLGGQVATLLEQIL